MAQQFLLSAAAGTLSLVKVARMSEDETNEAFRCIRWACSGSKPVCSCCDCNASYTFTTRRIFKCKAFNKQFSVTSGTIFASRKLPVCQSAILLRRNVEP